MKESDRNELLKYEIAKLKRAKRTWARPRNKREDPKQHRDTQL